MAKKQGISYSPNTALIQGAGVAYKNWDNVAGMYGGLDEAIDAGTEMMETAVKGYEDEQKKLQEDAKAEKAKKAQQDKNWYDISGSVYENAGSFMKDVEYKDVTSQITALKPRYIAAKESGNPEEMATVMMEFNNIKSDIDGHKAFRETITDPKYGLSAAMDGSGVIGGDNGEDKDFMTGLIGENYEIINEGGEKYYKVGDVKKTMKEIKDMAVLKDIIPFGKYVETRQKYAKAKTWDKDNATFEVINNVIPKEFNKLRAFLADDSNGAFGNGKNFTALLNDPNNKKDIMAQINKQVFDVGYMEDGVLVGKGDGSISKEEYAEFVLAVTDPKHKTWDNGDGTFDEASWQTHATEIAAEQLVNGIGNAWKNNPDNKEKTKGRSFSEQLAYQKYQDEQKKIRQEQVEEKNTVYTIENEFNRGDKRVGSKNRYAVVKEARDAYTDNEGNEFPAKEKHWVLYDNDKIIDEVSFDSEESLDEITKHVMVDSPAGKHRTRRLNATRIPTEAEYAEMIKLDKFKDLKPGAPVYYHGYGAYGPNKKI